MSIAGLGTYSSKSFYYTSLSKSRSKGLSNGAEFFENQATQNGEEQYGLREAAKQAVRTSPYTRCITANIKTEEMYASWSDNGEMIYSYQATEQRFQIFIKSDGENKSYTVNGIDKDGNPFEKEIDPYNVDPEYADFPEFSALCMYIQQTDETADMLANDYFASDDIMEKKNYLGQLRGFGNDDFCAKTKSMIDCANRLFDEMYRIMNLKNDINSFFEPFRLQFLTMNIEEMEEYHMPDVADNISEVLSSEKLKEETEEDERITPLGIGFANAGNMGYGMSASLVEKPGCDDAIVRVKIATGNGSESVEVNLSKFDPKNATAVEMFAYCQYKDVCGEGINSKWGSWNAMKSVISPTDGIDFGSLDSIMNEKMNWTGALAKSKTILEKERTGEKLSAADLLKMFKESHKLSARGLKESEDWRDMSDDEWDKMLEGVDKYIDAFKERLKQMREMQEEAARKAALEAPSDRKTVAASTAALNVAANGFDGGSGAEGEEEDGLSTADGADHEKNWTKKLKTDDQTILRSAKAAQDMEKMAMSKFQEVALTDETTVGVERAEGITECASVQEDENGKKTWTITAFTEQGIISKKCQDGIIISQWELKYKNSEDAKKVWDFLAEFDKDADLKFAGSKSFWEAFLSGEIQ